MNLARIGCLQGEREVLTLQEARVKMFQFVFETRRLAITRLTALCILANNDLKMTYFAFFVLFSCFPSFLQPDREVKEKLARIGCLKGETKVLTLPEARLKMF